jgi:hypothetical protein
MQKTEGYPTIPNSSSSDGESPEKSWRNYFFVVVLWSLMVDDVVGR